MKAKLILALLTLITFRAGADVPDRLKCSDAFQSLKVDDKGFFAVELRNGSYEAKFRRWEVKVSLSEIVELEKLIDDQHLFSAVVRVERVDGKPIGDIPLSKAKGSVLEAHAICYQDRTVYP
jgi:hypothetical protein